MDETQTQRQAQAATQAGPETSGVAGTDGVAGTAEATDAADADAAEATEPHEPSDTERAARDRVRRRAAGMTHHETAAALEAAQEAAEAAGGTTMRADEEARATVSEWQRITDVLFDHGGPYFPDTDAFVQGQLTARGNRRRAAAEPDRKPA
ncbi:hypothetical protein OG264_35645 [Streptomyces xanthophaeus]|uniref:hypothetical protein n=1 Tax=Streptomyces xanthophaeus TaxID=67385 RepID=UPI0038704F65|nr:hypothetical protein OG264_35645 [Streptomyces xanthophaeus]WST58644.1 hypothetical protein OG605_02790 [Streptomyces xanthophaeus]